MIHSVPSTQHCSKNGRSTEFEMQPTKAKRYSQGSNDNRFCICCISHGLLQFGVFHLPSDGSRIWGIPSGLHAECLALCARNGHRTM